MNDKRFTHFLYIVAGLFIAWWLFHRRTVASSGGSGMMFNPSPALLTYSANPSAFNPQTVNGNVDISVRGYNTLNQAYMPLFGFVGMAAGQTYA